MKKQDGFIGQSYCVLPNDLVKKIKDHVLCRDLYVTDIGFYPRAAEHGMIRKYGCAELILIYCISGKGWYQVANERKDVSAHEIIVLPSDTPHSYGSSESKPWTIYWMHIAGVKADKLIDFVFGDADKYLPAAVDWNDHQAKQFEDIVRLMEAGYNFDNLVEAMLTLPSYLLAFRNNRSQTHFRGNITLVNKSIEFMKLNINTHLTLSALANDASLSTSQYSTIFSRHMHRSPINYYIFLKMQHACNLLKHNSMGIKQVAYELGYDDEFYFSRIFTKVIGVSPREFRNK